MKGIKICPNCSKGVGCRSFACQCGYEFLSQKNIHNILRKKKKNRQWAKVRDWTELVPGDKIKVVGGGAYYVGENVSYNIGYKGIFTVLYLDKNGIHCNNNIREGESAHCYIQIVRNESKKILENMFYKPYRIRKFVA